jgi:hypothetical protein
MRAQNSEADKYSGSKAHVKTISIYSIYDQVLQWEGKKGVSFHQSCTSVTFEAGNFLFKDAMMETPTWVQI